MTSVCIYENKSFLSFRKLGWLLMALLIQDKSCQEEPIPLPVYHTFEFFNFYTGFLPKAMKPSLPYNLPIAG